MSNPTRPYARSHPRRHQDLQQPRISTSHDIVTLQTPHTADPAPEFNSGLPQPTDLWGSYFSLARLRKPRCLLGRTLGQPHVAPPSKEAGVDRRCQDELAKPHPMAPVLDFTAEVVGEKRIEDGACE